MKIFKKLNPMSWFKRDPAKARQDQYDIIMRQLESDPLLLDKVVSELFTAEAVVDDYEFNSLMDEADRVISEAEELEAEVLDEDYPPVANPDVFLRDEPDEECSDIFQEIEEADSHDAIRQSTRS